MVNGPHQLWMDIDQAALWENCLRITVKGQERGSCQILAAVRADAYGHGLSAAKVMAVWAIRHFGVASAQEGIFLRERGID